MKVPLLDLTEQHATIAEEVRRAIVAVVDGQRFILGPEVEALESEVADLVGASFGVGCASGTDALLLPLRALGAPPGAEVVVPAFTFFATAGAVWNAGLKPVFCDVRPDTFTVDAATVEAVWSDRTRAVIPVHLFGQMADLEGIRAVAARSSAFVLEDAAQAIGARHGERRAGSAADAAAFSFFPTKNLGAYGDGGMITTSDAELAVELRRMRVHGETKRYHHASVGTNSRLDALQAAVLRAKLPHLDRWTAMRRANASLYDDLLADVPDVIPPARAHDRDHVFNQYTVRARRRDELARFLAERGVGSGIYYPVPLHLQPCFRPLGYGRGDFPVAERLSEEVLSLPIYPELGAERIRGVAAAIRAFYQGAPARNPISTVG